MVPMFAVSGFNVSIAGLNFAKLIYVSEQFCTAVEIVAPHDDCFVRRVGHGTKVGAANDDERVVSRRTAEGGFT